jgi:hypothetical protein
MHLDMRKGKKFLRTNIVTKKLKILINNKLNFVVSCGVGKSTFLMKCKGIPQPHCVEGFLSQPPIPPSIPYPHSAGSHFQVTFSWCAITKTVRVRYG